MIARLLKTTIKSRLFNGKTIILYGARQVGKTTLVKSILEEFGTTGRYLNCEIMSVAASLSEPEPMRLKSYLGNYKLIVLDEAQSIPNIGLIIKVIHDTFPEMQIIATGSSSFDLANKTSEPLTGRSLTYLLHPISAIELVQYSDWITFDSRLDILLRFGSYPDIVLANEETAIENLNELATAYLYKDLLKFEGIRKSAILQKLLKLLALQVGNQISLSELANNLGVNKATVEKYIDLLEQSYVIFRLNSFSRNLRKELSKSFKVYFYDLGIRNSIIQNFTLPQSRSDVGALWENFCISERMKSNHYQGRKINYYFWRTYNKKKIDLVEEREGVITGYEFKYSPTAKFKPPNDFITSYQAEVHNIHTKNFYKFVALEI